MRKLHEDAMHEDLIDILKAEYLKQDMMDVILSEVDHYGYGCDITIKHGEEDRVERLFDVRHSEITIYVSRLSEHSEIHMFMSFGTYVIVVAGCGVYPKKDNDDPRDRIWHHKIASGVYAKAYDYNDYGFKKEFILVDENHYKLRTQGLVSTCTGCTFDTESPIIDLHNKISLVDNSWVSCAAKIIGTCEISGRSYIGPDTVLINTSLTGNSYVENSTVKNSVLSGDTRIIDTNVTASVIENCKIVESDEVVCRILTNVEIEHNKKRKK